MNVGLYFGSFNPVHIGHLIIANHVAYNTDLDQVWFVVSPQNPFKSSSVLLNEYHRLHMIKSAIDGENKLRASSAEFKLPRPSYTVDTLAYLKEKYPQHLFSIVMGSDGFQNLDKWKNADVILNNHSIYVYRRPGFEIKNRVGDKIILLNAPLLEISSTHIREMVRAKRSIRFLVPDTVYDEIINNGYYRS